MAQRECRVKVVLTKAGETWDSTKTYALLDYIAQTDGVIYVSKKTANTGNALTDTEWWDKVLDLSDYITKMETATANATEIAQHPTYIGEDFYVYVWDTDEKLYKRTDIYVKGEDAFDVAVHAGYSGTYDEWAKLISDWSMAGVIDLDDIYNLFNNK